MSEEFERLRQFLAVFSRGVSGYIGLTRATRSEDPEDNKRWAEFANLFVEVDDGDVDLPEDVLGDSPAHEWFFTPAVLSEDSRLQSKFKASNVIWVDYDEPVNWERFDPAPSVVVQTSADKVHCYWLLAEPITDVNDMRYWCRRLLENFEGGDVSGFDATQLLKLPYGRNLKLGARNEDGTPFVPHVIKFDTELVYAESAFEHLAEPTKTLPAAVDLTDIEDMPDAERSWLAELSQAEISDDLAARVRTAQDGGEEKRSGALYALTMDLLKHLGKSEVFRVLVGSPNDKFSQDHGAEKGASLLWRDICRIEQKREHDKARLGAAEYISEIMASKQSFREKGNEVKDYVFHRLAEEGRWLQDDHGQGYYVDNRNDVPKLYEVDVRLTSVFAGYISRRFGLDPGVDKSILTGVLHSSFYEYQDTRPVPFRNFAHYNAEGNRVYVDRNDGMMYLLDGDEVQLVPQGFDDVFFHPQAFEPFEYRSGYKPGGFNALILDGPNYTTHVGKVSKKQIKHILKTWVCSFFFPTMMNTKPIVLINGEADSGKTSLYQNLSIMFSGDATYSVSEMPTDTREFNTQATQCHHIFYDNVEVNKKEMQVKLAQIATGYAVKTRVLHTTSDMKTMKARAFVGITSITLDRIQKDVAQRYIIVPVHPYSVSSDWKRRAMSNILQEVANQRDDLWSEILDYVNKMVARIARHGLEQKGSTLRMADYGALLQLTAEMDGLSALEMEEFIRTQQTATIRANDPLFEAMKRFMLEGADPRKKYLVKELYAELKRYDRKFERAYPTTQKLSNALRAFINGGQFRFDGIFVEAVPFGNGYKYRVLQPDDPDVDGDHGE